MCNQLSVIALDAGGLRGSLCGADLNVTFSATSRHQLALTATVSDVNSTYNRLQLNTDSRSDEVILGLGEQFSTFNLKGSKLLVLASVGS